MNPIQTSYTDQVMGAYPGQLSDLSLHDIIGGTIAQGTIQPGKFVCSKGLGTDGLSVKVAQVASANDVSTIMGIALNGQFDNAGGLFSNNSTGYYQQYAAVPVLAWGRAFVLFAETTAPIRDNPVFIDETGSAKKTTGTQVDNATFTGVWYQDVLLPDNTTATIAEVQIRAKIAATTITAG